MLSQIYSLTVPNSLAVGGIGIYEMDKKGNQMTGCGRNFDKFGQNRDLQFELDILEGTVVEVDWYFRHVEEKKHNNFHQITMSTKLTHNFSGGVGLCLFEFNAPIKLPI